MYHVEPFVVVVLCPCHRASTNRPFLLQEAFPVFNYNKLLTFYKSKKPWKYLRDIKVLLNQRKYVINYLFSIGKVYRTNCLNNIYKLQA